MVIFLSVEFERKDVAKSLGAKWDQNKKLWYIPDDLDSENKENLLQEFNRSKPIVYLNVPFDDKEDAKDHNAWWDSDKKLWYIPPRCDSENRSYLKSTYLMTKT